MNDIFEPEKIYASLASKKAIQEQESWPKPTSLTSDIDAKPYPIESLPKTFLDAVYEVSEISKAPIPLIVSTALSAASMAVQAHADGRRAEYLVGPVSLFILTVADSGERKSTCDSYFTKAVRAYQSEQKKLYKPVVKEYQAEMAAWESKFSGIRDKIRLLAKDSKPTAEYEELLKDLEQRKPEPPRVPSLIVEDGTPEALKWRLAKIWPSGGLISSEAGLIFGSHGMGKESIMRYLATLNQLWDGTTLSVERRTSECFEVQGARLTVGLQVQEATLSNFFEKDNGLARGTGFLARFLLCCPQSTQGNRPFSEALESTPALDEFNQKITRILNWDTPIFYDEGLKPQMLEMTTEAKKYWVDTYNFIEDKLRLGGQFHEIADIASKAADNIMRLAVVLQVFESEHLGHIELNYIERAAAIVNWHLHESLRFFGNIALPPAQLNATKVESWLIQYCKKNDCKVVPRRELQRNITPTKLRDGSTLEKALNELEQVDRIRLQDQGKQKFVNINPNLLTTNLLGI